MEHKNKHKKRALITGQYGSYLAKLLASKNYEVYRLIRRVSSDLLMRIEKLSLDRKIKLIYGNLRDIGTIVRAIKESDPDEIYNLAAQSHVGVSFECPEATEESHTVRDFVNATAKALEMKITWHGRGINEHAKDSSGKVILKINPKYYRPNEVNRLRGDSSKAKKHLGWKPSVTFEKLVEIMATEDLKNLDLSKNIHREYA